MLGKSDMRFKLLELGTVKTGYPGADPEFRLRLTEPIENRGEHDLLHVRGDLGAGNKLSSFAYFASNSWASAWIDTGSWRT